MHRYNVALLTIATLLFVAATGQTNIFAQGFGDYVAPSAGAQAQTDDNVIAVGSVEEAKRVGIATVNTDPARRQPLPQLQSQPQAQAQYGAQQRRVSNMAAQSQQTTREVVVTPQSAPSTAANATSGVAGQPPQGGYVTGEVESAIVPPPTNYNPTEAEQQQLNEFLARWEEFGLGVKRVSCDVHMREFDGVLQQNSKTPFAHTWGHFRFITPNQFMYHIRGEFIYSDASPEGEWKEGQNEWMIVLNSKEFLQYDFKNKNVVVYPVVSEEQDMDLTMDNGQFPLFFVANANVLKNRFYMRIVTPASKQKTQVWIEAFPRYARDAQQFRSITVILGLKDLQPTYMRRVAVNGKSKTDLTFEKVQVNKGQWKIEGAVDKGWTREVRDEEFSILRQQPIMPETAVAQSPSRPAQPQTSTQYVSQRTRQQPAVNSPSTANSAANNRRF
ncbi:MAG: hypothetical protein ACOX0A_01190 [Thermoguttaceae bacterium]